ncbi:methyl-accepting chemotaxis protein [Vibrio sp. HA2012]|uniref:methyl-accepting chemotaxis protein n=1 Tax=Vibrio sp. HA2012 TaxID=1971595 RepID=UPI0018E28F91|nr:methyl-accepting chemotaxis protein [Vibrio sp. HA2012]
MTVTLTHRLNALGLVMYLSLIQRVIAGFAVVILFVLTISGSAYFSQVRMAEQLELTASTLTGLLDRSNTMVLHIQNANRLMLVHANSTDADKRDQLRHQFTAATAAFNDTFTQVNNALKTYPELAEKLTSVGEDSQSFIRMASEHLDIQDQRIAAREASSSELKRYDSEWIFFDQDIADLKSDAEFDDIQQAVWDLDVIQAQGIGAKGYLQKVLAVDSSDEIQTLTAEVEQHLNAFTEKTNRVMQAMPSSEETLKVYLELLTRSVSGEQGLLQQHLKYLALQNSSTEQLQSIAHKVDMIIADAGTITTQIRAMSEDALITAQVASSRSVVLNIVLTVVSMAVAVVVAVTVVISIRKPLAAITEALSELARGNLTYRIDTEFRSEMGIVVRNINELGGQLNSLISKIQQSAQTVSNVADQSHAMSQKTNRDVEQQRRQTDSIATAVTEMESAVHEVASHAVETSSEVEQVTSLAHANMDNMQSNLEFIGRLKDSLDKASGIIQNLSGETQQIGEVLTVIQGISEQTNLLALNAAIEAARAGEQGRGFAVVADEVRSLANRSRESADEISQMILSLQEKSREAVSIVEDNQSYADQSVSQTTETSQSLQAMVERLGTINDMSRSIATACEEQSVVAKDVAENVVGISDMATNIAQDAQALARNSESLNQLSSEQSELVSQFKI